MGITKIYLLVSHSQIISAYSLKTPLIHICAKFRLNNIHNNRDVEIYNRGNILKSNGIVCSSVFIEIQCVHTKNLHCSGQRDDWSLFYCHRHFFKSWNACKINRRGGRWQHLLSAGIAIWTKFKWLTKFFSCAYQ